MLYLLLDEDMYMLLFQNGNENKNLLVLGDLFFIWFHSTTVHFIFLTVNSFGTEICMIAFKYILVDFLILRNE